MRRVAGVDYGRRRIGLAVSDPLGITVRGLDTVVRGDDLEDAARRVAQALVAAGADLAVVGLPLHDDGAESEMSAEARRFGAALERQGLAVAYLDEGLSSWAAEEELRERGANLERARRGGEVDREVARGLVRVWLAEHPESRGAPP
jgi:putative Holliday junction resolvase